MLAFVTAENITAVCVVLCVLSSALFWVRGDAGFVVFLIVWLGTGGWCLYFIYCLSQIPDLSGYRMFG